MMKGPASLAKGILMDHRFGEAAQGGKGLQLAHSSGGKHRRGDAEFCSDESCHLLHQRKHIQGWA